MTHHRHSKLGMTVMSLFTPALFFIINSTGMYSLMAGWGWLNLPKGGSDASGYRIFVQKIAIYLNVFQSKGVLFH